MGRRLVRRVPYRTSGVRCGAISPFPSTSASHFVLFFFHSFIGFISPAAATTVVNQTLSQTFSGILGLALPRNSVILDRIPGGTTSDPDGAPFTSNLFGIEPIANRPPQHFYSIALGRPGSTQTPSVLGVGRHPSDIVDDPSRISYSSLIPEPIGTLFWKVQMRALTVFVNGREVNVDLGRSVKGSAFPEAILDTGVPYIIARPGIANAIWGAMGVSPAEDGNCEWSSSLCEENVS